MTFELSITRVLPGSPMAAYRAWTEPELLQQWFTPRPWTTPVVELDVRPGGSNRIVMRGPDGESQECRGVYLETIPGKRLVITDAFVDAWTPSEKPFLTTIVTFAPHEQGVLYVARALHWSAADRDGHEQMGFHQGWGMATDQLAALLRNMA
jgi:uncharacterized protein YndB with AHSA1/START domain